MPLIVHELLKAKFSCFVYKMNERKNEGKKKVTPRIEQRQ